MLGLTEGGQVGDYCGEGRRNRNFAGGESPAGVRRAGASRINGRWRWDSCDRG